jgi:cysteinyl-tRNA synthetase
LFETIRESNRAIDENTLTPEDALALVEWWNRINTVLALEPDADSIPAEILALLEERKAAREAKDWKKSDELRDKIAALGWTVKDMKDGQKVTRAV